MGTKAGSMGVSARPAVFTFWTAAVAALAAAALIMSAMALTVAARDRVATDVAGASIHEGAGTQPPFWDAAKLEAMESRMLAESARIYGYSPSWDAAKLEAMGSRMLAEAARSGQAP